LAIMAGTPVWYTSGLTGTPWRVYQNKKSRQGATTPERQVNQF